MGTCFPKAFDSANEDGVKERRSSWLSSKVLFPGSLFYTQKTWNENYALKRPLVTLTVQSRQAGFTSSLARSSHVFSLLSSSSQLHSTAHMLSRVAFSLLCSDCSDRMYRWAYSIAAELLALPLSVSLRKKNKQMNYKYLVWLLTIIFTHYGVKIFIHTSDLSDPAISSEGVRINQM